MGLFDEVSRAFGGGSSVPYKPPPNTIQIGPSPQSQLVASRGLIEGTNLAGGYNLDSIPESLVKPEARDRLKRQFGDDFFDEPHTLEELLAAGINGWDLDQNLHVELRNAGLTAIDPNTGFSTGVIHQDLITQRRQGLFPEIRQARELLSSQGLEFLEQGLSNEQLLQDPLVNAFLNESAQGVRGAFASRGLNQSGAAALLESTQGILTLEQVRQARQQEGLNLLAAGQAASIDVLALPLELGDLKFQRDLFRETTGLQLHFLEKGRGLLERESQLGNIVGRQVAMKAGENLGSFIPSNPFAGGGGGGGGGGLLGGLGGGGGGAGAAAVI